MKKIGILAMVAVLALGALGVGYAAWSADLNIAGTVTTGTFTAVFGGTDVTSPVYADAPANVAQYTTSGTGTATLTILVTTAYPNLVFHVPFTVTNTGSVPIHDVTFDTDTSTPGITVTSDAVGAIGAGDTSAGGTNITITVGSADDVATSNPYTITAKMVAHQV